MTYRLKFIPSALKEWEKITPSIQKQFKNKLAERLENPHIISAKLSGYHNVYKIKLRSVGYRLVYEVFDKEVVIYVIAVGKRNKGNAYKNLADRKKKQ